MTRFLLVLSFSVSFGAASQIATEVSEALKGKQFAHFESPKIVFDADTLALKKYVSNNVRIGDKPFEFDRVEIREKTSIGSKKQVFYFVILTDPKQGKTVSRLLEKRGNDYFFSTADMSKELWYTCDFGNECDPNLLFQDGQSILICGTEIGCVKPGERLKCPSSKTLIGD